jgi:hypothetical protein
MSNYMVGKARGPVTGWQVDTNHPPNITVPNIEVHGDQKPGYYCFLPLTVPADVVLSPIEFVAYLWVCADSGFWKR